MPRIAVSSKLSDLVPSPTSTHQKGSKKKPQKEPNYKTFINNRNLEVFYKIPHPISLHRQGYYLLTSLKEHYVIENKGSHTQNCLITNSHLRIVQTKARDSSQHLSELQTSLMPIPFVCSAVRYILLQI